MPTLGSVRLTPKRNEPLARRRTIIRLRWMVREFVPIRSRIQKTIIATRKQTTATPTPTHVAISRL